MMARTMANISAHQKPSTLNPGTMELTAMTRRPMMTKVSRPSVRMLIGRVIRSRIGRMMELTIPSTTATTRAVKKLLTWTPGRM